MFAILIVAPPSNPRYTQQSTVSRQAPRTPPHHRHNFVVCVLFGEVFFDCMLSQLSLMITPHLYTVRCNEIEGQDSVVGLDGSGAEFRCGRDFQHPSISALGPIQPPIERVPGVSRVLTLCRLTIYICRTAPLTSRRYILNI
jgi:hypothetical protein